METKEKVFVAFAFVVVVVTLCFALATKDPQATSIVFCAVIVVFSLLYLFQFGHLKEFNIEYRNLRLLRKETGDAEEKLKRMKDEMDEMSGKMKEEMAGLSGKVEILGEGVFEMSTAIEQLQKESADQNFVSGKFDLAIAETKRAAKKALDKANEPPRAI